MQVSIESSEGLERRMKVELPAEQVNETVEKRLKELARTVRLDGFRPGKVPVSIVRKRFSDQVRQEVFGDLVKSTYFEALTQENLVPAGEPEIEAAEDLSGDTMGYVAVFEVMPEIEIKDLSGATIRRPVASVSDEDLEKMLDKLRRQRTTWNEVEREARDGDQVTVDFKGFIDGEAFEGGSAEGVPLVLGSGSMIDGFEEGLLGARAGDKRTLELKFPEDYRVESLAGKDAVFEVEVRKVSEPVLPALDEEFARAFGVEEGGVEALRKEVRANMERELEDKIQSEVKQQAMDALLEAHALDVPKALVRQEAEALQRQARENMAQGGQASSIELPLELFEEQAQRRVRLGLIIGEVIKANEIEVDKARVRERVERFAAAYEDPAEVIDYYYSNKGQLAPVENLVLEDQVVEWVLEQAGVEEVETDFDRLMNPSEEKTA
ncbi:MAG TPA: trigger factor [Sedimenticola sp.]|nr:trigger factor [Sedimenticola sp.]